MKVHNVGGKNYWIVTTRDDLLNWNVLHVEDWKPGVKRIHATNAAIPAEFRMLYCRTEYLEGHNPLEAEVVIEDLLDAEFVG